MKRIVASIFLVIICVQSFGWGATGHRATGLIADRYLTKKARKSLQKILGNESLALITTWMDEIRSDSTYNMISPDWHWVDIPDGTTYETAAKNPKGDIIQTLERIIAELKSKKLTPEQELINLKMLMHLVGDIHQPLHVGRGTDRGGNNVKVMWHRADSDLHSVWDSDIINETRLSYTEFVASIPKPSEAEVQQWQKSSVHDWAHESKTLREKAYAFKGERLSYSYSYYNLPTVKQRINQAGVRLAGVLNEIYK